MTWEKPDAEANRAKGFRQGFFRRCSAPALIPTPTAVSLPNCANNVA